MILDRYELLELIAADEERKSFKARDISSSRDVIVHVLSSQPSSIKAKPDLVELAKLLFRDGSVAELLFAGESDGTFYVVSESRAECRDVRTWLEQQSTAKCNPNPSDDALNKAGIWKVPAMTAPSSSGPGEFTRMLQSAPGDAELGPKVQGEVKRPPVDEAGEFTRMFSTAPDSPGIARELPSTPLVPKAPQPNASEAGDFTRMFSAAGPAQSTAPADPSPGQMTHLFQTPSTPASPAVEYLKDNPESVPGAKAGPSGFTSLFGPGALKEREISPYEVTPPAARWEPANAFPVGNPPVSAPKHSDIASDLQAGNEAATGIFRSRATAERPVVVQQPAGPSEFTQVVAVRTPPPELAPVATVPSPTPSTPPPSAPHAATVPPSYLPLILILNGLFVLAILVILYFALKK